MLGGAKTVLAYQVELLNADERSAGRSPAALVASGDPPTPVTQLQATATRDGVLLRWHPENAADAVEVERLQLNPPVKQGRGPASGAPSSNKPLQIRLRTDDEGTKLAPFRADAGGMMDATALRDISYTYIAQRVRHVVLEGHALELRSTVSPPVTITVRDVFPPHTPLGVEAIAGQAGGVVGIDLSWTPNTEDDLAGYLVYRREATDDAAVCITPSLVLQPAFRDAAVTVGHTYAYTVQAVDLTGNRSAPSTPAQESAQTP